MIGVGENDRSAEFLRRFLCQPFDRGRRAHWEKPRRLDNAVWGVQLAPARGCWIRFLYFKRKTHLVSVSGENPRPPYPTDHVNGPHAECNVERLAAPQLLGIRRRKADGQQDQRPKRENIERLQQRYKPLRGIVRQDRGKIGRYRILEVDTTVRLQIEHENKKEAAQQPGHERVRRDGERGAIAGIRPAQQIVSSPHHQGDHQNPDDGAKQTNGVSKRRREFGAAFNPLFFLLGTHIRGLRAFLHLLTDEFPPINALVDCEADADAEQRQENDRKYPTRLPDNVFKRGLRREKHTDDPTNRTDCRLRLRIWRGQGCSCCHRGSSTTGAPLQARAYAFYPALRRNARKISAAVSRGAARCAPTRHDVKSNGNCTYRRLVHPEHRGASCRRGCPGQPNFAVGTSGTAASNSFV